MQGIEQANIEDLNISVAIADRTYRLTVSNNEEALVREAAKGIHARVKTFAESYAYRDKQDLLAMVALQLATDQLIAKQVSENKESVLITKLSKLNLLLEKTI